MPETDPESVHEAWHRACRADELLSRLDPPPDAVDLVGAVIQRIQTRALPPRAVLAGHAAALSAPQWTAAGEVVQRQIGRLMMVVAETFSPDPRLLAEVHMEVSGAAAFLSLSAWRGQAETDALTGLRNSLGLSADLDEIADEGRPTSVAFVDLDGLKSINDSRGHEGGNDYIRQFSYAFHESVAGAGGSAYRPHGDEFVATMPLEDGALEEVLAGLESSSEVPFSWGIAQWPEDDPDIHTVQRQADKNMYRMKEVRKKGRAAASDARTE